mgnify:CR=1 FL=1
MVRLLHYISNGGVRGSLRLLVLWQLPSCVVPPPEEVVVQNHSPELDWNLTTPIGPDCQFDRTLSSVEPSITFSLENAVFDPDGDSLQYVWYWRSPGGAPWPVVGEESMTLFPCEFVALSTADSVEVVVWVHDEDIKFSGGEAEFPISYETGYPLVRYWTLELLGNCMTR